MRESEAAQAAHRVRPVREQRTVISLGMVDYPSLPEPKRWTRDSHDDDATITLESFVVRWWEANGWWSSAVLSPALGVYKGERPKPRMVTSLWKRLFKGHKKGSLSPHPGFSAFRRWGDADAARAWLREVARDNAYADWESL